MKILSFLLLLSITLCQRPLNSQLSNEESAKLIQKIKQTNSIIKQYNITECLKFWIRLHPKDEQYANESEENQKETMGKLCNPCNFSSFTKGWCIYCCRDYVEKRKPRYITTPVNNSTRTTSHSNNTN